MRGEKINGVEGRKFQKFVLRKDMCIQCLRSAKISILLFTYVKVSRISGHLSYHVRI